MATGTQTLEYKANTSQAKQQIKELGDEIKTTGSNTEEAGTKSEGFNTKMAAVAAGALATVAAFKQIAAGVKECIDMFSEANAAEIKLGAVIENTNFGKSVEDLKAFASELQGRTIFGDDEILSAAQNLIQTMQVTGDQIEDVLSLSADLATAMGTDITSASSTLALALQDPESGLRRLRQAGIAFSDEEQEMIKNLVASGNQLEAQNIILDAVRERYEGLAESIASTDAGKLTQISNVWGDLKESLGGAILQSIGPALGLLLDTLNKISEWTQNQAKASAALLETVETGDAASAYAGYTDDELLELYNNNRKTTSGGAMKTTAAAKEALEARGYEFNAFGAVKEKKFATGGIVTQEINGATIGEAGPEAVIPLDSPQGQKLLGNGVNINITVQGNADEKVIYDAIQKAQRTGALPAWGYTR